MQLTENTARALAQTALGSGPWECRQFGAGKFSTAFAVTGRGEEFVLRIAPPDEMLQLFYEYRMMRQEPALHTLLGSRTAVPVPEIIFHDFSRSLLDRDFLFMRRLSGMPFSERVLAGPARQRALREWGGHVREIHSVTESQNRFGYIGPHNCMKPQRTWAEAFSVMYEKEVADIVNCGVYDSATARSVLRLLADHLTLFHHCPVSHLCHGDLWITNLLVLPSGRVTGVIDFDRACWGDPEWDLAIADYCGVTRPPFQEGYGSFAERTIGDAAVRRLFYLLYEHQKYIVISMSARRNDPARAHRYAAESLSTMEHFRRTGRPEF